MTGRVQVVLGEPPPKLEGFPTTDAAGDWYRAHSADHGPWWFAHDGGGRFDLDPPHGTCYLGSHVEVAVRERLGQTLVAAGMIPGTEADRMVVSQLRVDTPMVAADMTNQRATDFGVTRELGTLTPYDLPRRWAAALRAHGLGGLRYWPRFSLDGGMRALAVFGSAGADQALPTDPKPMSGRDAAEAAGIVVVEVPARLPTVDPPE